MWLCTCEPFLLHSKYIYCIINTIYQIKFSHFNLISLIMFHNLDAALKFICSENFSLSQATSKHLLHRQARAYYTHVTNDLHNFDDIIFYCETWNIHNCCCIFSVNPLAFPCHLLPTSLSLSFSDREHPPPPSFHLIALSLSLPPHFYSRCSAWVTCRRHHFFGT